MTATTIHPVTPDRFDDLADLFETHSGTRGCWCMYFIAERKDTMAGWHTGGNRAAFEAMATTADPPMGLLAYDGDTPVAWAACGPRSRYPRTIGPRGTVLKGRDAENDDAVWLVPCFFVRVGFRRQGTMRALLQAIVDLAREKGALAVEGIPIAKDYKKTPDGYYGKEQLFEACGFTCIARPTDRRAVMRLDLR